MRVSVTYRATQAVSDNDLLEHFEVFRTRRVICVLDAGHLNGPQFPLDSATVSGYTWVPNQSKTDMVL